MAISVSFGYIFTTLAWMVYLVTLTHSTGLAAQSKSHVC